jgi:hypothetical protein
VALAVFFTETDSTHKKRLALLNFSGFFSSWQWGDELYLQVIPGSNVYQFKCHHVRRRSTEQHDEVNTLSDMFVPSRRSFWENAVLTYRWEKKMDCGGNVENIPGIFDVVLVYKFFIDKKKKTIFVSLVHNFSSSYWQIRCKTVLT